MGIDDFLIQLVKYCINFRTSMEKMELIFDSFEVSGNGTDDISSYNPVCKIYGMK